MLGVQSEEPRMKAQPSTSQVTSEIAVFGRLIQSENGDLDERLARYVLTLGFAKSDQDRMNDLAKRNQDGILPAHDREELQSYVRAGHLLALLQSKARKSLKRRRAS
jgi:hypothetical protein